VSGSIRFRLEQITAVTDSVQEQSKTRSHWPIFWCVNRVYQQVCAHGMTNLYL